MIQHFTYERLYAGDLPGWKISFYYNRIKYEALYHGDGTIEVENPSNSQLPQKLQQDIHALMAFHVYE